MDELVGRTGLVLGDVLQMDGLLQEDLPLDPSPVVSLNRVDHLHANTEENTAGMNFTTMDNFEIYSPWWQIKRPRRVTDRGVTIHSVYCFHSGAQHAATQSTLKLQKIFYANFTLSLRHADIVASDLLTAQVKDDPAFVSDDDLSGFTGPQCCILFYRLKRTAGISDLPTLV